MTKILTINVLSEYNTAFFIVFTGVLDLRNMSYLIYRDE